MLPALKGMLHIEPFCSLKGLEMMHPVLSSARFQVQTLVTSIVAAHCIMLLLLQPAWFSLLFMWEIQR